MDLTVSLHPGCGLCLSGLLLYCTVPADWRMLQATRDTLAVAFLGVCSAQYHAGDWRNPGATQAQNQGIDIPPPP